RVFVEFEALPLAAHRLLVGPSVAKCQALRTNDDADQPRLFLGFAVTRFPHRFRQDPSVIDPKTKERWWVGSAHAVWEDLFLAGTDADVPTTRKLTIGAAG